MARRFGVSPRRWVVWVDNLIMSRCKAVPIALRSIERRVLTARARRARGEQRDVVRARIVLAAADGQPNAAIARRLGVTEDTCVAGGDGSRPSGCRVSMIARAPAGPGSIPTSQPLR